MFAVSATLALTLVLAVKAQDFSAFPSACSTQCAAYVKNAVLCTEQFPPSGGTTSGAQACFCDALSTAALSTCASCLTSNNAASAATYVTGLTAECQDFTQKCTFECDFPTCNSADISCQCAPSYLQNIYNCASCNTNNNNAGTTQVTDYDSLVKSCEGQSLVASADAPKSTDGLPEPSTAAPYTAPALTGNGVENTASAAAVTKPAVPSTLSSGTVPTSTSAVVAGKATTPVAGASGATGAGSSTATASGVAITAKSGANNNVANMAFGGAAAFVLSWFAL